MNTAPNISSLRSCPNALHDSDGLFQTIIFQVQMPHHITCLYNTGMDSMAGRVHSGFYLNAPKGSSHPATSWLGFGGLNQKFEDALAPSSQPGRQTCKIIQMWQCTAKAVVLRIQHNLRRNVGFYGFESLLHRLKNALTKSDL